MNIQHSRSWLVLAAVTSLAVPAPSALADQIAVRSGEHKGFTRLVLDLPSPVPWQLKSGPETAQLALSGVKADFDLSDTFRRLSTGRVAALASDGCIERTENHTRMRV